MTSYTFHFLRFSIGVFFLPFALFAQSNDVQLDNMAAFGQTFGYIRYFHPADQLASTNWNYLASVGADNVRLATDANDLATRLTLIFNNIASNTRHFPTNNPSTYLPPSTVNVGQVGVRKRIYVATWLTTALGYAAQNQEAEVKSGVIPAGFDSPAKPALYDLGGGVSAYIPHSVSINFVSKATLPVLTGNFVNPYNQSITPTTKGTNEGTVIVLWNVLQHFYPAQKSGLSMRDALKMLQDQGLTATLKALTKNIPNPQIYQDVLASSSGDFLNPDDGAFYSYPPFAWSWIENQVVITRTLGESPSELGQGDVVKMLDGQPISSVLQSFMLAGIPQSQALDKMLQGNAESVLSLQVQKFDGSLKTLSVKRTLSQPVPETSLPVVYELRPDVVYMNLNELSPTIFANNETYFRYKNIILDARNNPSFSAYNTFATIASHFAESSTINLGKAASISQPNQSSPTLSESIYTATVLPPYTRSSEGSPVYKTVILLNEKTHGDMEGWLRIFRSSNNLSWIGAPSAGSNSVFSIALPQAQVVFNTSQLLNTNSTSSVQPDVSVKRTIRGVRAGRDEILNRAILAITGEVVANEPESLPTKAFELAAPFPNPTAQNVVQIPFALDAPQSVQIEVYNLLGSKVATLVHDVLPSGQHQATWQLGDAPNGLYLVRAVANGQTKNQNVIVLR
jgi:hypothetical protein